ncbi:glycosyltransferase family 9 protein [Sphingomonas sp. IW22]|uniref:glycosyltransferase family 9 protein n=1 Tax=Sphingomonas sp. IW22 TaxID=3242489 RepID=UPI003521C7EE
MTRTEMAPDHTSFRDTAGMIANLDLVICCDSSVAHVAGAMGKPVLLILPWLGDWRWMLDPYATPWYPHTRLLRSPAPGEWDTPVRAAAALLTTMA